MDIARSMFSIHLPHSSSFSIRRCSRHRCFGLEYATMPNAGTFPCRTISVSTIRQRTGLWRRREDGRRPDAVEERQLLILVDAIARTEGIRRWHALLAAAHQWAQFLREKGLDPENQLTTDDFAGHVAHNSNLSIKAITA